MPHQQSSLPLRNRHYDAVIVGSGPNGLAAATVIARTGRTVLVIEGAETIGGGMRSAELTLPGFIHDVCAAILPLTASSPYLNTLPLSSYGLSWIEPPIALAHPLDDGSAALLLRSVNETAKGLGCDAEAYRRLMKPIAADWSKLVPAILGPLRLPRHPIALARFGLYAIRSAAGLVKSLFKGERARALFAGIAAHSMLPLERPPSAAFGLLLGAAAHAVGWPLARGGTQKLADAMVEYLRSLSGEIITGFFVQSIEQLPAASAILCDITPRQLLRMAGKSLPEDYARRLAYYRYGPGVFKVDWALDGPIPWRAAECARAGTVHVGGTFEEIAAAERAVWQGEHPRHPFVLLAQQSLFDETRAPTGKHTAWAYCHVPGGSSVDMTEHIEAQIERFAPGFRERILARSTLSAAGFEHYNPNYIGGDINGGVLDLWQLFTRPVARPVPYTTPNPRIYLCSSSTPPGGGVHGMCGYFAAHAALRRL